MKRREVMKGASSTDLLVCFPSRSHLTLMPKTICSPSRTSSNPQNHRHYHRGKSIGGGGGGGGGLWSKRNQMGSELSEPTSPKVTCAGQIKIEMRLDNNKKHKKKPNWVEAIGLKKESMQFLTSLKSFKFDLGCFGAFPNVDVTSDDEVVDDDDDDGINHEKKVMGFGGHHQDHHGQDGSSRSTFSKWFMVLENLEEIKRPKDDDDDDAPCVPPSNALLLMRCHSAPAKSWLEEKEEEEQDDDDDGGDQEHDDDGDQEHDDDGDDDDDEKKRENLMDLMKYEGDFYKLSCDIAKETWVVGGIKEDPFSRTQSSKRCSTKCLEEVKACLQ